MASRTGAVGAILKAGGAMFAFGVVVTILHVIWLIAIALGGCVCGCIIMRNLMRLKYRDYEELD
jgi:hypothetical protein